MPRRRTSQEAVGEEGALREERLCLRIVGNPEVCRQPSESLLGLYLIWRRRGRWWSRRTDHRSMRRLRFLLGSRVDIRGGHDPGGAWRSRERALVHVAGQLLLFVRAESCIAGYGVALAVCV